MGSTRLELQLPGVIGRKQASSRARGVTRAEHVTADGRAVLCCAIPCRL